VITAVRTVAVTEQPRNGAIIRGNEARSAALLLAVACGGARPAEPRREVRLVVLIVIDQLPSWSFLRREKLFFALVWRALPPRGASTSGDGIRFARILHRAGGTRPLATGAPRPTSGIVANTIWIAAGEIRPQRP